MKSRLITLTLMVLFGGLALISNAPPASAFTSQALACGANTVQIPYSVVTGSLGHQEKLAELTVGSTLQGKSASVTASTTNNTSVHPGTLIIVSSGSTNFTLNDVEGSANKVTTASGTLTLGSTIDFTVQLGSDGVFSGGGQLNVTVNCPTAETPPAGGRGGETTTPTPQVKAPTGAVNAGMGGATEINTVAIFGLSASLLALGYGLLRIKKHRA